MLQKPNFITAALRCDCTHCTILNVMHTPCTQMCTGSYSVTSFTRELCLSNNQAGKFAQPRFGANVVVKSLCMAVTKIHITLWLTIAQSLILATWRRIKSVSLASANLRPCVSVVNSSQSTIQVPLRLHSSLPACHLSFQFAECSTG